jgi:hypothetical protein
MQERRTPVQPYRVDLVCDCGEVMKQITEHLSGLKIYKCPNCQKTENSFDRYPRTEYQDVRPPGGPK